MADDSSTPKKPTGKVVSKKKGGDEKDSGEVEAVASELPPSEIPPKIPLVPLRDVVVYPHMVIPLFVGREKSILLSLIHI